MSKMKLDRKPPLAKSPIRLRPRRTLRSNSASLQTPPGSLTKTKLPKRTWDNEELELRPEYCSISFELRALAKMVGDEFGNEDSGNVGFANNNTNTLGVNSNHLFERGNIGFANALGVVNSNPLFERGRFYDEYSARRNERLKRKKNETRDEKKTVYDLGVKMESVKRRDYSKKFESARKSASAIYSVDRSENSRYLLRSSKENKKPPLYVNYEKSVVAGDKKIIGARRVRKI